VRIFNIKKGYIKGLQGLRTPYCFLIVSRILYALSAWGGFLTADLIGIGPLKSSVNNWLRSIQCGTPVYKSQGQVALLNESRKINQTKQGLAKMPC